MSQIIIAGRNYAAIDVKPILYNVPLLQVRSISLNNPRMREMLFGMGSADAVAYGEDTNQFNGSITLVNDDLKAIRTGIQQQGAPSGLLTEVGPGLFQLAMFHASKGLTQLEVYNIMFTSDNLELALGQTSLTTTLPFVASGFKMQ